MGGSSSKLLCPAPLKNLELLKRGPEIHNDGNPLIGGLPGQRWKAPFSEDLLFTNPPGWFCLGCSWWRGFGAQGWESSTSQASYLPFSRTAPSTHSPSLSSKGLLRQILDRSGGPTGRMHRRGVEFFSLLFPKISFLYVGLFRRRIKQAFIFADMFTFSKRISS